MAKKILKSEDGMYHIKGKKYQMLVGSRAQVWHGTAYKTQGGLTKDKLMKNKREHIVSRKKHLSAKRERRLEKAGYFTQKGKFGYVKKSPAKTTRKNKKR